MPDAIWGPTAIQALIGICTIYQNSLRKGSISGPEFRRMGRSMIDLLEEMQTVLEKTGETTGDVISIGTGGWRLGPRVAPEERQRLSEKMRELIEAIQEYMQQG